MYSRALLALTVVIASPALAQPAKEAPPPDELAAFDKELDALFAGTGLTSDQAANKARKVSPDVAANVAQTEIAIAQAEQIELQRVPHVGANLTYTRLSDVEVPVLDFTGTGGGFRFPVLLNTYVATARVAVNLSDYVLRYPRLIDAAELGMEAARTSMRSSEVDAAQLARIAYYEWVRAELQVLVARRQLAQVQTTLRQVRALADVQRVSRADLLRVESQEAEADRTLTQLLHVAELREEQVRILIDAPAGTPLVIGEDIRRDIAIPSTMELDAMLGTAKKQRLDFKVLEKGIAAREAQRDAERASLYPRLSAFAQADYANPNQRVFPQEEKFSMTWLVGAQLSWTLNDALFARSTDRQLRGEANQLRANLDSLERAARVQVLSAMQALSIAQAALVTTRKGLIAAEEGYRVRRELLNAQRATAVELVDAETDLTRARIAALNARVDLRVALAELGHALGNDIDPER